MWAAILLGLGLSLSAMAAGIAIGVYLTRGWH